MYFRFVFLVIVLYFLIRELNIEEERKHKWFCLLAFLVVLFIHCFIDKSELPDLENYRMEFEYAAKLGGLGTFIESYFFEGGHFHEIGWATLNFIVSRFSSDFNVFLNVVSLGICGGYSWGIYKMSKNALFSFLFLMLYFSALPQSLFVLRQHLAAAVFLATFPYITLALYRWIAILGLVVCVSFHTSALILAPMYFACMFRINLLTYRKLPIFIVGYLAFTYLLNNLTYEHYAAYLEESATNTLSFIETGGVLLYYNLTKNGEEENMDEAETENAYMIRSCMVYSALACLFSIGFSIGRLSNYFTIFLTVSVPFVVSKQSIEMRLLAYTAFIAFCVLMLLHDSQWMINFKLNI